jgi:hypothetical protein
MTHGDGSVYDFQMTAEASKFELMWISLWISSIFIVDKSRVIPALKFVQKLSARDTDFMQEL